MARPERDRSSHDELIAAELEQLRRLEPPAEDVERRRQILRSVLQQGASHTAPVPLRWRAPALGLAAVAAAALCALWIGVERGADHAPQSAAGTQPGDHGLRLASGQLEERGKALASGARIGAGSRLRTSGESAQLVLTDASLLRAAPSTAFVYAGGAPQPGRAREERFQLEQGRVSLQVHARARRSPLVVETAELSAWVVGTRFDVTREQRGALFTTTVSVSEGVVRVVAKAHGEERLVGAGEQITFPAPATAERDAAPEPEPLAPARKAAAATSTARGEAREPHAPPHALSVEIRRQLRQGAVGVARRMIQRAERERAVSRVELSLLQAEADLAERRYERAKSRYLAIVTEHAGSPEAELSLFAAAQLSRGQAGVDLLQRYLARYPDGRFSKEAHRLLQALDVPGREH